MKGLSDGGVGGVEGVQRTNGGSGSSAPRAWSPQPPPATSLGETMKKEMEPPLLPRTTSPRPSGRIALPADSPIPIPGPMPPPIFSQGYPLARPPFPNIYSSFGFNPRPEPSSIKPTSTSALGFPPGNSKTTELASPGVRDTSQYSKFDPLRPTERERDNHYDSSTPNSKQDFDASKSPALEIADRDRSPASSIRRPSSSGSFEQHSPTNRPKHVPSDSTTDKITSPLLAGGRIYGSEDKATDHHFKTERPESRESEPRRRSFSGEHRDSLSRLSSQSTPSSMARSEQAERELAAQDLRTNDQEERIKRESNMEKFETLRRLQAASAANSRHDTLGTIQKLELFQQSREAFLGPGGFNVPLTAPLGIPASDLARIAISVPDPAGNGELSSGSGRPNDSSVGGHPHADLYRNEAEVPILRENLWIRD